jgi:integrase
MATFRKLNSGKWQARVSRDGKEFSIGTFRTKKEAQIEAGRVEERIYYGQTLADKNMMFDEVAKDWLEEKRNNLKESTYQQYESALKVHILPFFGNNRIAKIRRADVTRWTKKQLNEGLSYGSRLRFLSILKGILFYAVHELEILEKSPADKLKVPVKDKTLINKEVKYYTLEELNKLLDFMENYKHQRFNNYPLYYTLILFLSRTGLRISEALAIRWSDIEDNIVNVERQTRRDSNNNLILTSLKNSASYRKIKISKDVVKQLNKFKSIQNELILGDKNFHQNKDKIVFQNFLGNYLTPSTVRDMFQSYCEKANVDYKGTHVFRHTHAVLLLESGSNLKYVAHRLGHKTIKTTADKYLAITEKMEDDQLEIFSEYIKR